MANIGLLVLMFLTILIVMGLSLIAILIMNGSKESTELETFKGSSFVDGE